MRRFNYAGVVVLAATPLAWGWGAAGHRIVAYLALDGLPPDAPAWLHARDVRDRIAYQSNEPDRWRRSRSVTLQHAHKPDHYLDVDLLDQFGLTLESLPPLRNEYLRVLVIAKHAHPDQIDPYDTRRDPDRTKEWPGTLPFAIVEEYAKLQSTFHELRILEDRRKTPAASAEIEQARANVIYHLGLLSHYVADASQPLHTTKHFNGWVGDNPEGFTTDRKFHAYVDTGILRRHGIKYELLKSTTTHRVTVAPKDPWNDVIDYIRRTHTRVRPLYRLQRDGELDGDAGREFVSAQLRDAAAMHAALVRAAYESGTPTSQQVADFVRYDEDDEDDEAVTPLATSGSGTTQPATQLSAEGGDERAGD